jgi:hypothetical protein
MRCERCDDPARFHFNVEVSSAAARAQAEALGEVIFGRRRYPGDSIDLCGRHAWQLRRECDELELRRWVTAGLRSVSGGVACGARATLPADPSP